MKAFDFKILIGIILLIVFIFSYIMAGFCIATLLIIWIASGYFFLAQDHPFKIYYFVIFSLVIWGAYYFDMYDGIFSPVPENPYIPSNSLSSFLILII